MRILLVLPDRRFGEQLQQMLRAHTYTVDLVSGMEAGINAAVTGVYVAIITHSVAGELDAVAFTRRLRNQQVEDPVMVLAEDGESATVIEALDAGADQVMEQSRAFQELLARVRAMLRQCRPTPGDEIRYRDVTLDLPRLRAQRAGRPLSLIGKPFALLAFFTRHPERVLTRMEIGRSVWDRNFDPFSNVIDVTVSKVRQQLDKPFRIPYLHTVVGSGYMLSVLAPGEVDGVAQPRVSGDGPAITPSRRSLDDADDAPIDGSADPTRPGRRTIDGLPTAAGEPEA